MFRGLLACALWSLTATGAFGQNPAKPLERLDLLPREASSDYSITPIFGQLVLFSLPQEFRVVATSNGKARYTRQAVPAQENVGRWSQMITVSGDEAMAFSSRTYPQKMVDDFAGRMQKACPDTFATLPLPGVFVGSYDTAVAVSGCGSASGGRSETVLQMVVKGGMDVYTFEWQVRAPSAKGPLKIDAAQWTDRIRRLAPIRLCSMVPNEQPPYPSCLYRR